MVKIINEKNFRDTLGKYLNEEMIKAAEPILQDALKKIELEMRKSIAKNIIAFMASDYDMQIDKNRIMIMLGRDKND